MSHYQSVVSSIALSAIVALSIGLPSTAVRAQDGTARSQFRRTTDDSPRSATGDIFLSKKGSQQTVKVSIRNLLEDDFTFFTITDQTVNVTFGSNEFNWGVAPLDRSSVKGGRWQRQVVGVGEAPAAIAFISDLSELAGSKVSIGKPGPDELVSFTNVFNCASNIVGTVTNFTCETNIVIGVPVFAPGITGVVNVVLWAPIPPLMAKPSDANFSGQSFLSLPSVPPSPGATGSVKVKLNNTRGQSVLDIRARGLTRGQTYNVWMGSLTNSAVTVKAGKMTLKGDGASAQFIRDTKLGDPLPQQAGFVTNLSGFPVEIRDEFEVLHLFGFIP